MSNKTCSVEGCNNKHYGKGYCNKHYQQFRKHGEIRHGLHESNGIIVYENYAEIILYDNKGKEINRGKIDIEDIEKVKEYKWHLNDNGYIRNNKRNELHRFLLNPLKHEIVDHINGNTLDNRKCNLRIVTPTQNNMNTKIRIDNTSGCKGVGWHKPKNKWRVRITVDKKTIELGYFDDKEEAIKCRKEAEEKYFGDFRRIE